MIDIASYVHKKISEVCPIDGVSIGNQNDPSTWSIAYAPSATDVQQQAAQSVLSAITPQSLQQVSQNDINAQQAKTLLDASDVVIVRCYEHGVPVPAAWQAYRSALRAIIQGTSSSFPALPAYPAGT
jgi:hypothetical protein